MSVLFYFRRLDPEPSQIRRNNLSNKEFVNQILKKAKERNVVTPEAKEIFEKPYKLTITHTICWTRKRKKLQHLFDQDSL